MNGLNVNEILRYGASGVLAVVLAFVAFRIPKDIGTGENGILADGTVWVTVLFTVGALGYAMYRALVYPIILRLCLSLLARRVNMEDFVRDQWKNQIKANALQPRLSEWGAQVHFLNASAVSALLLFGACSLFGLQRTEGFKASIIIALIVLITGIVSNVRYLMAEEWVSAHDKALPDVQAVKQRD